VKSNAARGLYSLLLDFKPLHTKYHKAAFKVILQGLGFKVFFTDRQDGTSTAEIRWSKK
jgi:hypothetical protein